MKETGLRNAAKGADTVGLSGLSGVHWNLLEPKLYEEAIRRGEGEIVAGGAFVADTGVHTGRSPKDKYVVCDDLTRDTVWWGNNQQMSEEQFDLLHADFIEQAKGRELFAQDLYGGSDPAHRISVRVYSEYAWHNLFIRNLLIRPDRSELPSFDPEYTIIDLPSFTADPKRHNCRSETIIAVNFSKKIVLVGNSEYAGEMKKSVFTILNYLLPPKSVMPMHCSANVGDNGDTALFFGLSGTGKTTLSADPNRTLIGDDEHGWSDTGTFNFEGGCYAKTINLSREAEPEIYATTERFGTVLENVVLDPETRVPDFDDATKTENARCAYPMHFIPNASLTGMAPQPKNIIMLTADAFGVMPPIAKLTPAQAMYTFLSGYTAKVAGTEKGVEGSQATFSTCFGAPFLPRHPSEYGNLLRDLIAKYDVNCWLVNTGWTGGAYGVGSRMPIKATRTLLTGALNGSLNDVEFRTDPNFGFQVPVAVPNVDTAILDPRGTWSDTAAYDKQAAELVQMFIDNFEQFEEHVDASVREAAPVLKNAAE